MTHKNDHHAEFLRYWAVVLFCVVPAIIVSKMSLPNLYDWISAVGGCFLLDFMAAGMHLLWHKLGTRFHMKHHRRFRYDFMSVAENLSYAAITLTTWIFIDAALGTFTLVSLLTFSVLSNFIGHSDSKFGRWHMKHHTRGNVNFSFTRLPDILMGTDSSSFSAKRLCVQSVVSTLYVGIVTFSIFVIFRVASI